MNLENLHLRMAEIEDMQLYLDWANDPSVRDNSFNSKRISPEEHEKWFRKVMNDSSVLMFVLMYESTPIGQCRLVTENEVAEINYSIDKNFRGQGMGKKLLEMIEKEVRKNHQEIHKLQGWIKVANQSSISCFEENSFRHAFSVYEKDI